MHRFQHQVIIEIFWDNAPTAGSHSGDDLQLPSADPTPNQRSDNAAIISGA